VILRNLVQNDSFCRKTAPFLKSDYFSEQSQSVLFEEIIDFLSEFNETPSKDALIINLSKNPKLKNEDLATDVTKAIKFLYKEDKETVNEDWLIKESEKWCQERAVFNAVLRSINIIEEREKDVSTHAIPGILQDALSVSFNSAIGHDYFEDFKSRYDYYHRIEERLSFDIDILNKITNGGLLKKTLTLVLAPTGAGKTHIKCHFAASFLLQSKNVLYITLEMAEEWIAKRIDANLLDVTLQGLDQLKYDTFENKFTRLSEKTRGRLFVKEYPPTAAHVGHFRALLQELKIKKNFVPDVIFVDYLGICASSRIRSIGGSINSYNYMKSVAEELRGVGVEYNVPVISSVQTNRAGFGNSNIDLTNMSESTGISSTADFILAAFINEELLAMNQMMFSQLKNRFGNVNYYPKFLVGLDRAKMKLFNLDDSVNKENEVQQNNEHVQDDEMTQFGISNDDYNFGELTA
jgi:replicative DNA helicase